MTITAGVTILLFLFAVLLLILRSILLDCLINEPAELIIELTIEGEEDNG